jgi:hypothetical protein
MSISLPPVSQPVSQSVSSLPIYNSYGFIIIRHVNSHETNCYWNHSIRCLRKFYPSKKIIIIDDNSNELFVKADYSYKNIEIIKSEFQKRGELLPYYYYLKYNFFDNAVIIHDSVFFHKRISFESLIQSQLKVIPMWFFYPDKENIENTLRITNDLTNAFNIKTKLSESMVLGMKHLKWYGCFGVQCFINREFLKSLNDKYKITRMINSVNCRKDRSCLERIFGCIFYSECNQIGERKSLLGNIMKYQKWGYSYKQYENDLKKGKIPQAIVKVWTGR